MTPMMDKPLVELEQATIGFCGDSGDGMQLAGTQFTNTSAILGNDISTLPRLPRRDSRPGRHPGRRLRLPGPLHQHRHLHARRPAQRPRRHEPRRPQDATSRTCEPGGILIVNTDAFADQRPAQGRLHGQPARGRLAEGLPRHLACRSPSSTARPSPTLKLEPARGRPLQELLRPRPGLLALRAAARADAASWIATKFGKKPAVLRGQHRSPQGRLQLRRNDRSCCRSTIASPRPSCRRARYRKITGNEALALGLVAAAAAGRHAAGLRRLSRSRPASDILHHLAAHEALRRLARFQAEDEIAAIGMAIGAAFGGCLGVTATSGPGICLKSEGDRPGRDDRAAAASSSTCSAAAPAPACRPRPSRPTCCRRCSAATANAPSPSSRRSRRPTASTMAVEAVRLAVGFMTPVFLLSDGYLANGAEPWLIPDPAKLPPIEVQHPTGPNGNGNGDAALPAVQARRPAGPPVGHPRHAGPGAPHRRPREGRRHRQRQLRPGQPRAHGANARPEDRQHRQRHPAAGSRPAPTRATCWCSAGAAPTARIAHGRAAGAAQGAEASRTPTCAT